MILAAHQTNFIPWVPYFQKMRHCDVFVMMVNCQFEKNGYQNRAFAWDKWLTMPVERKTSLIKDKKYKNGQSLATLNSELILSFAKVFGIDTGKIHYDFPTEKFGTERIIELCEKFKCNQYLTNPAAFDKYLDRDKMRKARIEIIEFTPSCQDHIFESFQKRGIEGTIKMINKGYANERS